MAATTAILNLHPILLPCTKLLLRSSHSINPHHRTATATWQSHHRGTTPPVLRFQKGPNLIHVARTWSVNSRSGMLMDDYDDDDDDGEEEEEEEDRSLDLLVRFVENVFRKVSRKARKAVKSVLPVPISTRLVGFAVNGTIILTFLWVLKAFLQVICTLGSVVFISILLIRGIWTAISYFQETRNYRADDDEPQLWSGTQHAN